MAEFQYLDGGNSEVQDMQAEAYLYASSGTTGIAASGVIAGLAVTQTSTASGSVLIATGACTNQASLGQGASRLINPSQKTLDVFTANPVGGLARRDIVVFDSVTKLIIAKIGVPNASPTDPTVLATEVALWRLRHDASATTIFTAHMDDLRVYTSLRGAGDVQTLTNKSISGATNTLTAIPSSALVSPDTFKSGDNNVIVGTGMPITTTKIRQEFSAIVTTTSGGAIAVVFPTAFPNGITYLHAEPGDSTGVGGVGFIVTRLSLCSLSTYNGIVMTTAGAAVASTSVRVNVVAVGW
jgi:hypothetical protein